MARDKIKSDPIDGYVYETLLLDARSALKMNIKLAKMAAPALAATLGEEMAIPDSKSVMDMDIKAKGLAIGMKELTRNLDSPDMGWILEKFISSTEIFGPGFGDSGAPMSRNFDDHFSGRVAQLIKFLFFCIKANNPNFLEDLVGIKGFELNSLASILQPSQSPSTSNGQSGD